MDTNIQIDVGSAGRDELHWKLQLRGQTIVSSHLTGAGCPRLLQFLQEWRRRSQGDLLQIPLPQETDHVSLLFRELILKARGEWNFPYQEAELCHCRAVPCSRVDSAILSGAHTVAQVSAQTSAGTSCGTCVKDIEAVLKYRIGHKAKLAP